MQMSVPKTDGAATSTPTQPESIVSDGIVSASGYEPKVLTLTATNLEKAKEVAKTTGDTSLVPTTDSTTTTTDSTTKTDPSFNVNVVVPKTDPLP